MKKLLIPIVFLCVGIGSGVGAGLFLMPRSEEPVAATETDDHAEPTVTDHDSSHDGGHESESDAEFAKLANQFIVPLVNDDKVTAMVVLSISLEVPPGGIEAAFAIEPRLRDTFLQVLFDHANVGGFSGNFTDATNMRVLRDELRRSAQYLAGDKVSDVLILDIVRQDI